MDARTANMRARDNGRRKNMGYRTISCSIKRKIAVILCFFVALAATACGAEGQTTAPHGEDMASSFSVWSSDGMPELSLQITMEEETEEVLDEESEPEREISPEIMAAYGDIVWQDAAFGEMMMLALNESRSVDLSFDAITKIQIDGDCYISITCNDTVYSWGGELENDGAGRGESGYGQTDEDHKGGIVRLDDLEQFPNLEFLRLRNQRLTNLTGLENCKNLIYLSLDENDISDVSALAGIKTLQYISLNGNPIDDAQLEKLEKLPFLRDVSFQNTSAYGNDFQCYNPYRGLGETFSGRWMEGLFEAYQGTEEVNAGTTEYARKVMYTGDGDIQYSYSYRLPFYYGEDSALLASLRKYYEKEEQNLRLSYEDVNEMDYLAGELAFGWRHEGYHYWKTFVQEDFATVIFDNRVSHGRTAAEPYADVFFARTGEHVTFDMLFGGKEEELRRIINEKGRRIECDCVMGEWQDWDVIEDSHEYLQLHGEETVPIPEEHYIPRDKCFFPASLGVVFCYPVGEIDCMAAGTVLIFVDYESLSEVWNPQFPMPGSVPEGE